jgi:hypothetical protein
MQAAGWREGQHAWVDHIRWICVNVWSDRASPFANMPDIAGSVDFLRQYNTREGLLSRLIM